MTTADTSLNDATRRALLDGVLEFLGQGDLLALRDIAAGLEREIGAAGAGALIGLRERLAMEHGWDYYPPDPLARRIHHMLADRFLEADSTASGVDHLEAVAGQPLVMVSNHLSYADANVIEVLLHRAGRSEAGRLTALAGPKVFSSRERRFSSLCFGTLKVPQSAEVASGEAVLAPRDVARAARRAIEIARTRLAEGDVLLLFGEGTRSRTGQMQPMLPAAARYAESPGTQIVPAALTGSEHLFPVDDPTLHCASVTLHIGRPIDANALLEAAGDRRIAMDSVGLAIADLLPAPYRGVYGDRAAFPEAAAALARIADGATPSPQPEAPGR
jgi:1-acyl-sn-glycerol-3-phosphate acyltransferase